MRPTDLDRKSLPAQYTHVQIWGCGTTAQNIDIGGKVLFAYVVSTETGLNVRFTTDEWERLGLPDGVRVEVFVLGKRKKPYYVASAVYVDPGWTWVTFESIRKLTAEPSRS